MRCENSICTRMRDIVTANTAILNCKLTKLTVHVVQFFANKSMPGSRATRMRYGTSVHTLVLHLLPWEVRKA